MMLKRRPKSMIHAHRGDRGKRSNPTASWRGRPGAGEQDACAAGVPRASYRPRVQSASARGLPTTVLSTGIRSSTTTGPTRSSC
jgi:hypothetical protein